MQVWWGIIAGVVLSLILGIILTVVFYVLGKDIFGEHEQLWEGILGSIAVVLLTWLAFRMLKVNVLVAKWERKIQKHTESAELAQKIEGPQSWSKSYSLAILSFTVVIREGLEAVIFIAGVSTRLSR
jgi:high-affinity iron transporter